MKLVLVPWIFVLAALFCLLVDARKETDGAMKVGIVFLLIALVIGEVFILLEIFVGGL